MIYRTHELPAQGNQPTVPYSNIQPSNEPNWGTLTTVDLEDKGRIAWQTKMEHPMIGRVLETSGGLLLTGQGSGEFLAFDAATGAKVWHFNCGAGVNAPPMSYEIDGKQFVAVAAGGSQIWGCQQGGALVAFVLAE